MLAKLDEVTEENCIDVLREEVALRDKMGGALYWNIINDDCQKIADKCLFQFKKSYEEVMTILKG